jgi:uncharacterized protein YqhQ
MLTPLAAAHARQRSDGTFSVESFPLPERKTTVFDKVPFIRILPKLFGQMMLVVKGWKPGQGKSPMPLIIAAALIGVLSSGLNWVMNALPMVWHATASSFLQIGLFFVLIGLTRAVPRFGRIWRFHGGEHQAIAAYERGLDLTVENARAQTLFHPRCGTNLAILALILMIPGMVFGSLLSGALGYLVTVAIPLPSLCVAFEMVMFGQKRMRVLLWPGLAFQRLTVARPGLHESTAGIMALRAALAEHQRVEASRRQVKSEELARSA